jgi:hypothetical protein
VSVSSAAAQSAAARWEGLKTSRVQGIGGITGKAFALSIIGGAVYCVIKLVDLVTDDAGAGSPEPQTRTRRTDRYSHTLRYLFGPIPVRG